MVLQQDSLSIRRAILADAKILADWWNDGAVMAHAGFINGVDTTADKVMDKLANAPDTSQQYIIELGSIPIGEMHAQVKENYALIGIKICKAEEQNKGYGKKLIKLFIGHLFDNEQIKKVVLTTNAKNLRAQHVYEKIGFKKVKLDQNSLKDSTGITYELELADWLRLNK